jgi:hypothetical protein
MTPINTMPLQQFIQVVRSADISQQREIRMDIKTAKSLVFCMSEINTRLLESYENFINAQKDEVVSVEMDGGGFSTK